MALKTKVKAGNITNLSDARYCAGMGVDFIGFPIGAADPENDLGTYQAIRSWISGPAIVLEWADPLAHTAHFLDNLPSYNAGFLEIHASNLEKLPEAGIPLMVSLAESEWPAYEAVLLKNRARISYVILEGNAPAVTLGKIIDAIAANVDVLLKLNASERDLSEILALNIKGVVLSGSPEERPGVKEYASLSEVLEQLEESDL